jgi:MFS superfamily sulfate permease-like transporter
MYTLTPNSMQKPALVVRWVPALSWLSSYQREWLRFDLVAGLTTAAVVIPKAMAYAAIAGLPLEVGLYTSLIPLVVYAVLGTSRPLSVTTSGGGPAALLSASATLSLLVGAFLLLAGLFRLGVVAIPTLILGVVMLALMLGLEHFAPKVPAALVHRGSRYCRLGILNL